VLPAGAMAPAGSTIRCIIPQAAKITV